MYRSKNIGLSPVSIPFLYAFLNSEKMNCVESHLDGKTGALYVGSLDAANDIELLKKHNVRAVLTVASNTGLSYAKDHNMAEHLVLPAEDIPSFDISKHFEAGISFIDKHRKHTNILIHCHAGISRSSTMVIAYLMKTKGWKCDKALNEVRKYRQIISPNPGFLRHLLNFERKLSSTANNENSSAAQQHSEPKISYKAPNSHTLAQSNARTTQSLVKKVEALIDRTAEMRPAILRGSQFSDKKKPIDISNERSFRVDRTEEKVGKKESNVKELQVTSIRDNPNGDFKSHVKSASMSKDPKPNYHFLRDRSDKPNLTPTEQRGFNFGRTSAYKGGSTVGGRANLNLRD